ncbi:2-C-methyl-D-erythritol 4-phosphate cytidylyltransferase [Pirellulaceae bacterium]|nr:2-C-methyl-D-erythritol 4-phosphate cytidylyltransferase [Pirellulaceae bacterium]
MPKYCVILPAAGSSSRFGGKTHLKKPFVSLKNQPVWLYSAQKFRERSDVAQIIVVISEEDEEFFKVKFSSNLAVMDISLVIGGKERTDSVRNALGKVSDECDFVAVHDAARPCLQTEWIDDVFEQAEKSGAAILASPIVGTIKKVDSNKRISQTVSRDGLWQAQTPQVFEKQLLLNAYKIYSGPATDDSQVVESSGHPVDIVYCPNTNIKITTQSDLRLAENILRSAPKKDALSEFSQRPNRNTPSLDDLFG